DAAIASMEAAQRVGAERFVMVSYFGASLDHGVPESEPFHAYAEAKARADEHLRGTELAWTILAPSRLTLDEPTGRIAPGTAAAARARPGTGGRFLAFTDGEQGIAAALGAVSWRAPAPTQEGRRPRPPGAAGDVRRPGSDGALACGGSSRQETGGHRGQRT